MNKNVKGRINNIGKNMEIWENNFHIAKSWNYLLELLVGLTDGITRNEKNTASWYFKKWISGTSLVAQWLRIHLPMQGTQVQALVREDPTCCGATKPVSHNCWSLCSTREAAAVRNPHTATKRSPRSPQLEKACVQQRRPNAAKIK